jgi:hypothetical protein
VPQKGGSSSLPSGQLVGLARGRLTATDIRIAESIVDYVFRWCGKNFLLSGVRHPPSRRRAAARERGSS